MRTFSGQLYHLPLQPLPVNMLLLNAWKLAEVISLYKNRGSHSDPSNYRPISLLPAIGKVMDDIQSSRLLSFLVTNKLISPHQFGFVPRSSTVHQLVYIIDKWTRTRDTGSNFSATFMDFMKAFDRVWHTGLLYKLAQCWISSSSLAWIQNYLSNRYYCASWRQRISPKAHFCRSATRTSPRPCTLCGLH